MTECNSKTRRKPTPRRHPRSVYRAPRTGGICLEDTRSTYLDFPLLGSRQVLASFDGGDISSDGGSLLLRKTEELTAIIGVLTTFVGNPPFSLGGLSGKLARASLTNSLVRVSGRAEMTASMMD